MRYLDRIQPLALLALRLTLGAIMIGHGYHKVNGHLHEHANFVASLHLPAWLGYVSSFAEFLGGILVLLGLCTRIAALAICINLAVAIFKVHLPHGLLGQGLIFLGAGPIAIDAVRGAGRSLGGSRSKSA